MLNDGSLLFDKTPTDKAGYTRDPFNKNKLVPTHKPCVKRISQPRLQRTGLYIIVNQCNHEEHPVRGQDVTPEDCANCPLRTIVSPIDGTLEIA